MTFEKNRQIIEDTLDRIKALLLVKAKEYIRNEDPLHNFKVTGRIAKQHPTRALDGMLLKHYTSYRDMLDDIEDNKKIPAYLIEEKFNDIITYFLLQKSQFIEYASEENPDTF